MLSNTVVSGSALALLLVLAGCSTPPDAAPAEGPLTGEPVEGVRPVEEPLPAARVPAPDGLLASASGCKEGGGHSLYAMGEKEFLDVWRRADVKPRLGDPPVGTYGLPLTGEATGIYHATVFCSAYTFKAQARTHLVMGFIVTQVEAPPFDTGGAHVHYLASQMLINDADIQARLDRDGVHAMLGGGLIEYGDAAPQHLRTTYDGGDMHGVFETNAMMQAVREVDVEVVRIWFLVPVAEEKFRPVALDVTLRGGTFHNVAGGATGFLTHTMSDGAHGPAPALGANVGGILIDGSERTFSWGPRPDVITTQAWSH